MDIKASNCFEPSPTVSPKNVVVVPAAVDPAVAEEYRALREMVGRVMKSLKTKQIDIDSKMKNIRALQATLGALKEGI